MKSHDIPLPDSYYAHETYREELRLRSRQFLQDNSITHVIGMSGDADGDKNTTERIVEEFIETMQSGSVAILSGGTDGGVPELATRTAKRLGVPTIGVYPQQGRKYALLDNLDFVIETTPPDIGEGVFGTETPTFVNMLDAATIIGGSYGTLIEVTTMFKANIKRFKEIDTSPGSDVRPIFIAPISGTGGAADHTYHIAHVFGRGAERSLPNGPVYDGQAAGHFLLHSLQTNA